MTDELKQPQRRALQYWYVDGTYELGFGLLCLILAIYFRLEKLLEGSWFLALVDGSLVLVFIGGGALINWLTRKWKERVTYPRTGYVAYRSETGLRRKIRLALGLTTGGLIGATVAVLATLPFRDVDIMPLVSGLLMGMVLAFLAWRTSLPRLYLLAAFSTGTGLALAFAQLGNYTSLSIYYLALSLGLIASGLVTMILYLRESPPAEREA